mmetsp:Transcript_7876/g.17647  ORF Transcript_7876/g.17647 Transcript_7876/m.17647 type:complete len:135 (+) Transcript_7876:1892-2296(+)
MLPSSSRILNMVAAAAGGVGDDDDDDDDDASTTATSTGKWNWSTHSDNANRMDTTTSSSRTVGTGSSRTAGPAWTGDDDDGVRYLLIFCLLTEDGDRSDGASLLPVARVVSLISKPFIFIYCTPTLHDVVPHTS